MRHNLLTAHGTVELDDGDWVMEDDSAFVPDTFAQASATLEPNDEFYVALCQEIRAEM